MDALATFRVWQMRLLEFARREGLPLREGNRVGLYAGGGATLEACRELIRRAARSLDVEMYMWVDDAVGNGFVDLLLAAIARGVCVRAVYDAVGCLGSKGHLERLERGGAHVVVFHPIAPWRMRGNPNDRNHRKLLIADDTAAVVASANWGRDYDSTVNPSAFLDVGLGVQGPAVADLCADFRRVWDRTTGEELPPPAPPREDPLLPGEAMDGVPVQVLSGLTRGDRSPIRRVYGLLVKAARRELVVANAYFVPGRRFIRLLCRAARRGVPVTLLLPGETDQRFVQAAARATYGRLLRAGVRIFERQGRVVHAKAAFVDGEVLVAGSANLDPRSFLHNLELNLNVHSPRLVAALREAGAGDAGASTAIDPAAWRARPRTQRLWQHFAYLFRRWL